MTKQAKTEQLQFRVSPEQKAEILAYAKQAGVDMSSWVLRSENVKNRSFVFAEMSDFLSKLTRPISQ